MKRIWLGLLLSLSLALAGCGSDTSCKNGCDKLDSCGLKSSGFSCDDNCKAPLDTCAACINENACADLSAGKCAADCPNVRLDPK